MKGLILVSFFCLLIPNQVVSQSVIDTLPTINLNYIKAAYELNNDKFLVAGTETNFSKDWGYIGVIRNGSYLWYNEIEKWARGSISQVFFDLADSTILAVYSIGDTAEFNIGLRKLDIQGNTIWDKFYGFSFNSSYSSYINKLDSLYTLGIYVHGFGVRYSRLCKIDHKGDTLKTFLPQPLWQDSTSRIVGYVELPNGNKVVALNKEVFSQNPNTGRLFFFDSNWNIIFSTTLNSGEYRFLQQTDKMVFALGKYGTGSNPGATILTAFDHFGTKQFTITDTCFVCFPKQIVPLSNGRYLFVLGEQGISKIRSKLIIIDSQGNVLSSKGKNNIVYRHVSESNVGSLTIGASYYVNNSFNRTLLFLDSVQAVNSASSSGTNAFGFPNPGSTYLNLVLPEKFDGLSKTAVIVDASGMEIKSIELQSGELQVDISGLNQGFYFLNLQTVNGERASLKFIKY